MQIAQYLEYAVYLAVFGMIFAAAYLMNSVPRIGIPKNVRRYQLKRNLDTVWDRLKTSLYDESAEKMLKEAGYPLRLNSSRYNLARFVLSYMAVTIVLLDWLAEGGRFPWSDLGMVGVFYVLTVPKPGWPVFYLLRKVRDYDRLDKNRECFVLYSMLLNEFSIDDDRTCSLYFMLQKMSVYFTRIRPALHKTLALYKRDPEQALDAFAAEVGTPEARDLAQILKSVDATTPARARDLIQSRYDQFRISRHENHRRRLKNRDLVGYVITIGPVMAILFNMLTVYWQMVQDLMNFVQSR
ncbi:hypothetical protein Tfer_0895 [Thermincola ferriacetica]|uniref:Type II secretion system F domain-containing protein n=1 Tax=Thermincola ferriacetica TaxID=281456 RepID=A0A0L6W476_9FIRM|nr:hypothetical protein [Thermincola ferriacetica]KNZ70335.1 hypothetical protein Tfer_0895 [Thermincola ferriacetica]